MSECCLLENNTYHDNVPLREREKLFQWNAAKTTEPSLKVNYPNKSYGLCVYFHNSKLRVSGSYSHLFKGAK